MVNGKIIFITGAGSGIGRDTAMALAKRGHRVIATTHSDQQAEKLSKLAYRESLSLKSFKLDVTVAQDREKILRYQVDVLINNAATGESGSLAEIDMDRVRKNFETNLFSGIALTQLALRGMMYRNRGRILFISSLAGRVIFMPFLASYAMTKYAVSAGAESLRQEIKMIHKNIHIIVIEPGAYHTGFNQKMMATKFEWMDKSSYFFQGLERIKMDEDRHFRMTEQKSTKSIVRKIIKACEADKPRFRYSAPWWQSLGIRLLRIAGK